MINWLNTVRGNLERSEKRMRIASSGSTPDSRYEKIRSGQSYLYRKNGMESEVLEVRFLDKVSGSNLNQALLRAGARYPYFHTRLVELDGDFYIVRNDNSMVARRTQELPVLGSIRCGYHLLDVTYYGRKIFISFHHALCDGRGVLPFVETLVYYYCRLQYKSTALPDGIRLAEDPLLEGETAEPFAHSYDYDSGKPFLALSRDAFELPENGPAVDGTDYQYEIQIPGGKFMRVCRDNDATPVILLALLMSRGICRLFPQQDKPVNANVAVDMRTALDMPNTFKNCVKSMILPYDRALAGRAFRDQAAGYRVLLARQRDRDFCRREANHIVDLYDRLDRLPSLEEKQRAMAGLEDMALNTYIISYLGRVNLGENARYIDSIHLYNSGAAGLGITAVACGDRFVLNLKQSFKSDRYVKAFCAELGAFEIPYTSTGAIPFRTPTDALIRREGSAGGRPAVG